MKKSLAVLLALVSLLSVFSGCASEPEEPAGSNEIVLPVQVVEETYENRQKAMLETAWAYYYKNPYVQYGNDALTVSGSKLGNRGAEWMNNTPEMAGPQRSIFLVCSRYCYGTTYHSFDLPLFDTWTDCSAVRLGRAQISTLQPYVVWTHTSTGDEAEDPKAMEEFLATLQPGDIFAYERKDGTGHSGIWLGDCDGDGDMDLLNVGGANYNRNTGEDTREAAGAVFMNRGSTTNTVDGEDFFTNPNTKNCFLRAKNVAIYRPADVKYAEEYPITERAKTRMLFPGLAIYFEAEKGVYGSVVKGGETTYTLTIENHSQQDHEGILVQLPVPTNGKIVKVCGEQAKNRTVKQTVDVPAGGEVVITYTVKATGSVGDIVETGVGYVHAIPLPSLNTAIVSADTKASAVQAAMEANKDKTGDEFLNGYLASMGVQMPELTLAGMKKALFKQFIHEYILLFPLELSDVTEENLALYKMQILDYFGGNYVASESDSNRVKEIFAKDLQPGDIFIWQEDRGSSASVAVHNGEELVYTENGKLVALDQAALDRMYICPFFIALRPSQAQ